MGETAFAQRQAEYSIVIAAQWRDQAENELHTGWVRGAWDALTPYASGGQLLTMTSDVGEEAVQAGFRSNYQRLVELKTNYDPTNFSSSMRTSSRRRPVMSPSPHYGSFRMTKVLVLTALESELNADGAMNGVEVACGGVGKINAAFATTTAIVAAKPALVVNYGTCGRITKGLRGLLEISQVVQRDMIAMPLAPRGVTPASNIPAVLASGHGVAVCGTGDSFVTSPDPWLTASKIDVVDMELFAIAYVCRRFGAPWRAFKFITDDAHQLAHEDWTATCADGTELFWDALNEIIIGCR